MMKLSGHLVAACVLALASVANAGFITEQRLDTNDIVIPVFNSSLGTLTNVNLTVTLRSGTTSVGGSHDHATVQIQSTNTVGNPSVGGFAGAVVSTASPNHSHSVVTPVYSGGGLNLGTFNFSTNTHSGHTHRVSYSYNGLTQVGPSSWRANAVIDSEPHLGSAASYSSVTQGYGYSGAGVSPFLAASDIVIGAGSFATGFDSAHNHSISFNPIVGASFSPGFFTWNFSTTLSTIGGHQLLLDPRFDVTAEFTYDEIEEVPEPSSFALLAGGGLIGTLRMRWRRAAA